LLLDARAGMKGRCYCGRIEYALSAEPLYRAQCHCRPCQHFTGGHPQIAMGFPAAAFRYVKGDPAAYQRPDLPSPVRREFCRDCGVHLVARSPALPDVVLVRPGTLDDPSVCGLPEIVVFTGQKQSFHQVPDGVPAYEGLPDG